MFSVHAENMKDMERKINLDDCPFACFSRILLRSSVLATAFGFSFYDEREPRCFETVRYRSNKHTSVGRSSFLSGFGGSCETTKSGRTGCSGFETTCGGRVHIYSTNLGNVSTAEVTYDLV